MPASKQTEYYKLSQFEPNDVPTWQGNYNEDMQKIDQAIHEASENGGDTVSVDAQDGKATITVTNSEGETKTEIKTITQEQSDKVDNLANIKKVGDNLTLEEDGTLNAEESTVDFNELENRPKYGGQAMSGSTDIPDLSSAVTKNTSDIATNTANIATNATNITANQAAITTETSNREAADNAIQQQIDALISKTDVVDIVQNYAALQAYDTSKLGSRDVVEVLNDENHDNALSYYRWNDPTADAWNWIGSIAPYYTKSEASGLFVPKTRTINGQSLAEDVVITLPTKLSQLTNDSGFITSGEAAAAYVPQSRTINNKPLSGNVTLGAGDVGAVATSDFTITSQGQTRANNLPSMIVTNTASASSSATQAKFGFSTQSLVNGSAGTVSGNLPMASATQAGCVTGEEWKSLLDIPLRASKATNGVAVNNVWGDTGIVIDVKEYRNSAFIVNLALLIPDGASIPANTYVYLGTAVGDSTYIRQVGNAVQDPQAMSGSFTRSYYMPGNIYKGSNRIYVKIGDSTQISLNGAIGIVVI